MAFISILLEGRDLEVDPLRGIAVAVVVGSRALHADVLQSLARDAVVAVGALVDLDLQGVRVVAVDTGVVALDVA